MNITEILNKYPPEKNYLLMILQDIQASNNQNYIPEKALLSVASYLNMTMSNIYGVVSYYSMLSVKPRGKYVFRICTSPVCEMMDADKLLLWVKQNLNIEVGETTADGLFTLETTECLGRCANAPSIMVNNETYTNVDEERLEAIVAELKS